MLTAEGFLLVLVVALVYGTIRTLPRLIAGRHAYVPATDVKRDMDAGTDLLVLDVRSPAEFSGEPGHIPGALNVPLEQLRIGLADGALNGRDRDMPVVAVCRSDARAAFAVRMLKRRGFRKVHVLSGGITAWEEEGFPLHTGGNDPGSGLL